MTKFIIDKHIMERLIKIIIDKGITGKLTKITADQSTITRKIDGAEAGSTEVW